jgi:uncharacterized protein (DUF305 family)
MVRFVPVGVLLAMICAGGPGWAQSQGMPGMAMPAQPPSAQSPSAPASGTPTASAQTPPAAAATGDKDLMGSMDVMNKAMAAAPMTGDVDQDFVAMMIPHHQGAVDMCKVEIRDGHDATLRTLCRAIVVAQTKEIALMKHWQQLHPGQH